MFMPLKRETPTVALDSAFHQFLQEAAKTGEIDSAMLIQKGAVTEEVWFPPAASEKPHICYSITKTVLCTAVGFAVQEGLISEEDRVVDFFPEIKSGDSGFKTDLRLSHLLTMSCGHDTLPPVEAETNPDLFWKHPISHQPGTHFLYSNPGAHLISCMLHKVLGMGINEYLTPRLWEPLGIETPQWEKDAHGIEIGGFGLYLKTEDLAKLGLFWQQQGNWNGTQLLNVQWFQKAISKQIDTTGNHNGPDWEQGYCYLLWRCRPDGVYRMDGYLGQFVIVFPKQEAVLVLTENNPNTQRLLDTVWRFLLPIL